MNGPIMEFKNQEELDACLNEWQTRLFLNDWYIKADLLKRSELNLGNEVAGENHFDVTLHCSMIHLAILDDDILSRIQKVSHEVTLIHELLHLKYNWVSAVDTLEGRYYDTLEHSLLEQMAKSLFMAKYNLTFEWFINDVLVNKQ
jgi:hypothetical protein